MVTNRLFSSLSSKKKDEVFRNTVDLTLNTIGLQEGLKEAIRKQIDSDKLSHYRKVFDEMSKRQYVFTYNKKLIFTLNVVEMKKKMLD